MEDKCKEALDMMKNAIKMFESAMAEDSKEDMAEGEDESTSSEMPEDMDKVEKKKSIVAMMKRGM